MHDSRLLISVILVSISLISESALSNSCLSPVEFAKSFYKTEYAFYAHDPKNIESLVTQEFYESLSVHWACVLKNEGLCIRHDPWSNSNSVDLGYPISLTQEFVSKNEIQVKFTFEYKWSEKEDLSEITSSLVLKKIEGGCWKVNDLIMNSGKSFSKELSQ